MTMMEIEERFSLNKKWGLVAFGGVAGLYGNDRNRDQKEDLFPAGGGGISYLLNDEKMVGRAEYAIGKEGNQGFYMTFGQPF
ncbi:MAG: hypothetical protein HUK40_18380 [Desulfobacter sp.]|nr:hypothetical protein [Desulfobacter sp.]